MDIPLRSAKLLAQNFITRGGKALHNTDLLKTWIRLLSTYPVQLNKVKAHQKNGVVVNYNIAADKLVRRIVRAGWNDKAGPMDMPAELKICK
jgi:ribonuclease HI